MKRNEEAHEFLFFSYSETDKIHTILEVKEIIKAKHEAALQHAGTCLEELLNYKY